MEEPTPTGPRARMNLGGLILVAFLTVMGAVWAGDTWGPDSPGSTPSRPPVVTAGVSRPTLPSPRPSPGAIVTQALDEFGRVLLSASPMPVAMPAGSPLPVVLGSPLLTTDLDSNGSTNVTTGAGVALLVPAAGGAATVPGDGTSGLQVQGQTAHDAVKTGNALRVGARAESLGGYSAVSAGDAADLITTTTGLLQTVALGPVAHDAAIAGNPVRLAGRARSTTDYSAVAADDIADWAMTLTGKGRVVHDADDTTRGLDVKFVQAETGGSTDVAVKASAGNLYKLFVSNPNTTDAYLSFYNASTVSTTVGSTTQLLCFCVPGGTGASNAGSLELTFDPPISFSTAITYALTTTAGGSTAPGSSCVINIGYK